MSKFDNIIKQVNQSVTQEDTLSNYIRAGLSLYRKRLEEAKSMSSSLGKIFGETESEILSEEAAISNSITEQEQAIGQILISQNDDEKAIANIQKYLYDLPDEQPAKNILTDCIQAAIYLYFCHKVAEAKKLREVPKAAVVESYHALLSRHAQLTEQDTAFYKQCEAQNTEQKNEQVEVENSSEGATAKDKVLIPDNISSVFSDQIHKASLTAMGTQESKVKTIYTLADYVLFSIQEYENEVLKPSDARKSQIKKLKNNILNFKDNDKALIDYLYTFFHSKEFRQSTGFHSRLKNHCLQGISHFVEMQKLLPHQTVEEKENTVKHIELTREKTMHTWLPKYAPPPHGEDTKKARSVILAIHGLQDSVATWEGLAPQLAAQGYEVISYDQAGHGFDELRQKNSSLDLQQMKYDFYHELDKLQKDDSVKEIHLIGHSLGGALLANSITNIHASNKVKSVTCISPAVMQSPILDILSHLPTYLSSHTQGDMAETTLRSRAQGISRRGGPGVIGSLFKFISFVANGFKNLRELVTQAYQPEHPLPWLIVSGKQDRMVSVRNFSHLKFFRKNHKEGSHVKVKILNHIGHHPHGLNSPTQYIVGNQVIEHIKASTPEPHQPKQAFTAQ